MTRFRVACYENSKPVGPPQDVDADTALEAAVRVCKEPLADLVKGELRATVWVAAATKPIIRHFERAPRDSQ